MKGVAYIDNHIVGFFLSTAQIHTFIRALPLPATTHPPTHMVVAKGDIPHSVS
jgi:hypothetical protein